VKAEHLSILNTKAGSKRRFCLDRIHCNYIHPVDFLKTNLILFSYNLFYHGRLITYWRDQEINLVFLRGFLCQFKFQALNDVNGMQEIYIFIVKKKFEELEKP
jgi:hypothetical protein